MSQSTSDQLKLIELRSTAWRVLVVVPVALALLFSWYAVRWYVGDFIAEVAPNMEDGQIDVAEVAMRLAPDDPWTHWMVASLKKRSLLPADLQDAARHYEEAVRLSPSDYRLWLDLGRTREELGDTAGGEKALRRAVELAPAYAYPHWYLGNLLLRAGRGEEGFAELRRAAEADAQMRPQLFNVAWALYGQNIDEIRKVVGDSAAARAEFATYLAGRGRLDDALNLWSGLKPAEMREQSAAGQAIMKGLLAEKRYRAALDIFNALKAGGDSLQAGQFVNGSFENDINAASAGIFNWEIKSEPQAQIAIDGSGGHNSARSLRIALKASENLAFANVAQTVVVEPATRYRFACFARARDLKSGGTLVVEIIDATDGKTILGTSPQPLATGTYDWQPIEIDFKTPPKTEAVTMRIVRANCGMGATCPIFGMVWYDDFNLQSLGGATEPRDARSGNKTHS